MNFESNDFSAQRGTQAVTELVQPDASSLAVDAVLISAAAIKRKVAQLGGEAALGGIAKKSLEAWFFHDNSCVAYNATLDRAFHIYGAIYRKWQHLGGMDWGVPCTDELGTPDGVGRFVSFENHTKSIYWRSGEAYGIWGPVREKWASMRFETSPLGYPVTDTMPTPDGRGSYNHFDTGAIYFTKETQAHVVWGRIYEHWARMNWEQSYLGYPTSDETGFPEGGRASIFENGGIYFWNDAEGAIDLRDVVVHYTGLHCWAETDDVESWDAVKGEKVQDEPYVIMSISTPERASTFCSRVYEWFDAGDQCVDLMEIYRGKPYGININTVVMEHDFGNPEAARKVALEKVLVAHEKGMWAMKKIPWVGAEIADVVGPWLEDLMPRLAGAIVELFGLADDCFGSETVTVSAREMVLLAARAQNEWNRDIGYKVQSPLVEGHDATYRAYYNIIPA